MSNLYRLDNGLTVVLEENHATPVVAFQAWVRVGSADEPEQLAGIAHVFEHMLFKGTAKRGVGAIAQEVEGAGGDINAWTSFDQTVYHLVLASRYFDTGLDIITDALLRSSFDPDELQRELKVVLEEVKQGEDNPSRIATQALFATAYQKHPYRRPVIGYSKTVEKFKRDQLLKFFKEHYVPSNITLVVVGDFDAEKAKKKINAQWAIPGAGTGAGAAPRASEPVQRGTRVTVTGGDVKEAHLAVAFHIPTLKHPDIPALDLAAIILGQGDSSRLQLEVKRNRQLVSDVYAYSYTPQDPGLLVAGATLPPQQLDPALEALLDETFRVAVTDATAEELAKAKTIIESDAVYQKETVQGQARKLGFYQTVAGSLGFEGEYQREVREVTPERLQQAVARYLTPDNCTISLLLPAAEAKGHEAEIEARLRARLDAAWKRAQGIARPVAQAAPSEVIREVLPGGARVLVMRDPSIPLVAMRAVWQGGLRIEDARWNGVNNLLAALVTRGTKTRSGDELAHEIESMAGSIGGYSGRNSFGLRAEVLSRHADRALELLGDCILHPAFDEAEVEKERRLVLEEIRTQEDNVSSVAFRVFAQTLYQKHPYRMDVLGTPESVAGLSRRRLADYYRRNFPPSKMTLAIVGDVDPARILAQARALFSDGEASAPAPANDPAPEPAPTEPRQSIRFLNRQQAHLVLGSLGTTVADADRFPLEVLSTILSGQGGRLFVELRDKRGLAYRVSAFSLEGVDPGYFAVYLATSPENLAVAEAGIRDELNKIMDHPVPKDELARAKRYLVGAHDISLQRRAALASTLAFHESYGMGWDEYRRYAPGILAVTAADVQRVARRYLDPKRAVLAVVKPEEVSPAIAKRRAAEAAKAARADADRIRAQPPARRSKGKNGRH